MLKIKIDPSTYHIDDTTRKNTTWRIFRIISRSVYQFFSSQISLENHLKKAMKDVWLPNGCKMPMVGLGTWKTLPQEVEDAVETALESGYRHIDTAYNYNTEEAVGNVVNRWIDSNKLKREDIFITTKLPVFGNRPQDVEKYLKLSLKRLNLGYVDLYLIHMPFSFHSNDELSAPLVTEDGSPSLDLDTNIIDTWKEMEQQIKNGLTKNIGLSNFNLEQVKRLHSSAEIKPAVLQVEVHAYLQQKKLREGCKQLGVAITAYSPLGSPGANTHFTSKYNYTLENFPDILGLSLVKELAEKYNRSPGQILLKHLIQQDVVVIPKSKNPIRIKSNIELFDFDLSKEDLERLDGLDKEENGRIFNFLFFKGVENHPEYPFK